jgi:DNA (cytosine-5)-methyltransferase 1
LIIEGDFVNELALFAGAGGGILGGKLLGWRTVCAVEWEPYPASVLCARQNDKVLETFPIWDDVQTFDGKSWRGIVDVVSGGFPCQDISAAGKGVGIDGERSGMWKEMARIIHEVRPKYAFVENSPMLTSRGLGRVLGDLAGMGFDARWGVLGAANVGANHQRDRIWIVAKWNGQLPHTQHNRIRRWEQQQESIKKETSNTSSKDVEGKRKISFRAEQKLGNIGDASWWKSEPNVGRVANGMVARVDRLKSIGNGQVPLCLATAWRVLSE